MIYIEKLRNVNIYSGAGQLTPITISKIQYDVKNIALNEKHSYYVGTVFLDYGATYRVYAYNLLGPWYSELGFRTLRLHMKMTLAHERVRTHLEIQHIPWNCQHIHRIDNVTGILEDQTTVVGSVEMIEQRAPSDMAIQFDQELQGVEYTGIYYDAFFGVNETALGVFFAQTEFGPWYDSDLFVKLIRQGKLQSYS